MAGNQPSKIEWALSEAADGRPQFPIKGDAKAPPLILGWQTLATCDPDRIKDWSKEFVGCNWGTHPVGHTVLDIDTKNGKDGYASFAKLKNDHPGDWLTRNVETPSGGRHLWFKGESANSVATLGEGLDTRSRGGYVLTPGSTVGGKPYRLLNDIAIAPAPKILLDRSRSVAEKAAPPDKTDWSQWDQTVAAARAAVRLDGLAPVAEGGRNNAAVIRARMCRAQGCSPDTTLAILSDHAGLTPPLDAAELERTVRSAYRNCDDPPGTESHEAMAALFEDIEPSPDTAKGEPAKSETAPVKLRRLHPSQITLPQILNRPYLVKGLLSPNSKALVFGQWGSGKTFNLLSLAGHVALGLSWFGYRVRQAGVLYLPYEGRDAMATRLFALKQELPGLNSPDVPFEIEPLSYPILKPRGREHADAALHNFARVYGTYPGLVIIDPLRNALGGEEKPEFITPYLELAKQYCEQTGCCHLTVHHPGHGNRERSRGDSALESDVDTVLKVDADALTIVVKKQRDDAKSVTAYELKVVTLGVDGDGDPVTTCVAVQRDNKCPADMPPIEKLLYAAAVACADSAGFVDRKGAVERSGLGKGPADGAWKRLKARGALLTIGRRTKIANHGTAAAAFDDLSDDDQ